MVNIKDNETHNLINLTTNICGIILAGGKGTRLGELTKVTNKHLLPVGQYPMIYYSIMKLIGIGIKDICIVTSPEALPDFFLLLHNNNLLECNISYRVQEDPGGVAHALSMTKSFCKNRSSIVLLGDNIFSHPLSICHSSTHLASIFLVDVSNPSEYGVAELSEKNYIVSLEEKPVKPKSKFAITGVYYYPPDVFDVIELIKPSDRGELEITDVNKWYLREDRLSYDFLFNDLEDYWIDAGTYDTYTKANILVRKNPPRYK